MNNSFKKACQYVGNQNTMAKELGVPRQSISQWVLSGNLPAKHVLIVERLTEGLVTREDLRPDLYPDQITLHR